MPFPAQAVIFDLDGTLTPVASPWRYVHEALGLWERAIPYHDRFFAGDIDYDEWARLDLGLWNGCSLKDVRGILEGIQPFPEALDVLKRVAGCRLPGGTPVRMMILSSGFDEIARRILSAAGIGEDRVTVAANGLYERDGRVQAVLRVALRDAVRDKRAHLDRFLARYGISPEFAVTLDDREQDRPVFAHLGDFLHVRKPADLFRVFDYLP